MKHRNQHFSIFFSFIFFIALFFVCTPVFAQEVISINDVKIVEKSGTIFVEETAYSNSSISSQITFNQLHDFVTYELEVTNNGNIEYELSSILNNINQDYISIDSDFIGETIHIHETKKIRVTLTYEHEMINIEQKVLTNAYLSLVFDNTNSFINPPTKSLIIQFIKILLFANIIASLFLIFKNSKLKYASLALLFFIPLMVSSKEGTTATLSFENMKIKGRLLTYEVTINRGNDDVEVVTLTYGDTLELPTPSRNGYNFNGWVDQNGNPLGDEIVICDEVVIIADFDPIVYTISYNLNGGSVNGTNPTSYTIEDEITLINPTKVGYTFAGWSLGNQDEVETIVSFGPGAYGDRSYTAIFSTNQNTKYTIIHQQMNMNGEYEEVDREELTGATDSTVSPTPRTYTGFITPARQVKVIAGDGSTVFTYKYEREQYTFRITNREHITEATEDGIYYYGTSITIKAERIVGYTLRWNDGDNSYERTFTLSKNTILTPTYSPNTDTPYKVIHKTMNLDGETYSIRNTQNLTGTTGATITPQVNTYEGFTAPSAETVTINGDGSTVVTYLYTRNKYNLVLENIEYIETDITSGEYFYETEVHLKAKEKTGFTFVRWTNEETDEEITFLLTHDTTIEPIYVESTNTPYKVIHRKMNLNGNGYEVAETEYLTGTTNSKVTPPVKNYPGFTSPTAQEITIKADGTSEITYNYVRNKYTLTLEDEELIETTTPSGEYYYGRSITLKAKAKAGYTFQKWSNDNTNSTYTFTFLGDTTIGPIYTANQNTPYQVLHKQMNLDGETYSTFETEVLTGTTDSKVTPPVKTYTGFTSPEAEEVTIKGDGSTSVTYLYTRNKYQFSLANSEFIESSLEDGEYFYGTEITLSAKTREGYTFSKWSNEETTREITITLGGDLSIEAIYDANNNTSYKVIHQKMNVNGVGYTTFEEEDLTGTTDSKVTPEVKTYYGFISPEAEEVTIKGDGSTVVIYLYERRKYQLTITDSEYVETLTPSGEYFYEATISLTAKERDGYTFVRWSNGGVTRTITTIIFDDTTVGPIYNANNNTPYKVVHQKMNVNGVGYTLEEEEILYGTTGEKVTPPVKTYTGFTSPEAEEVTIKGDGSTVVTYLYTRNIYQLTLVNADLIETTTPSGDYYYDSQITLTAKTISGYTFDKWSNDVTDNPYTFKISGDISLEAIYRANTDTPYKIIHRQMNLTGTGYEVFEEETLYGTTGAKVTPPVKSYTGFTAPNPIEITIKADGTSEVMYNYVRQMYVLTLENTQYISSSFTTGSYYYDTLITLTAIDRPGYTFVEWAEGITDNPYTFHITQDITLGPTYSVNPNTPYTVIHEKMDLNGTTYTEYEREELLGTTDTKVTPIVKNYPGFIAPEGQEITIKGDGSSQVIYRYTRTKVTLTIEDEDYVTTTQPSGEYYYETGIILTANEKLGYTFSKWSNEDTDNPCFFVITEDTTIGPVYTPNTNTPYKVIHRKQSLDGTSYEFAEEENLTGTTDTKVTPAVKNYPGFNSPTPVEITIKADGTSELTYNYTRRNYTLTIENSDFVETETPSGEYPYGTSITLQAKSKTGYLFSKWSNEETANPYTFTLTGDTIIGPVYDPQNVNYVVNHKKMSVDGLSYTEGEVENKTALADSTITVNPKSYYGFTSPDAEEVTIAADGSTVVNLYYSRNKFQLTIEDSDHVETETPSGEYYYETSITLSATRKKGYTFIKWSNDETANPYTFQLLDDTTIGPIYEFSDYVITLNANGGVVEPESINVTPEEAIGELPVPTREGHYTFAGWYTLPDGGEEVDESYVPDDNMDIYARWDYHPESTFVGGLNFVSKAKTIAGNSDANHNTTDRNIEQIKVAATLPDGFVPTSDNTVSTSVSDEPIYIWYESNDKILYYYTDAEKIYLNSSSNVMFRNLCKLSSIENINNWDASKVSSMSEMFYGTGSEAQSFNIDLSSWNVSHVSNFSGMFSNTGHDATEWSIGDLSNWNTSSATSMSNMFNSAGYKSTTWNVGDLSDWDVSHVNTISSMFAYAGYYAETIDVDLSNWNVSSVTGLGLNSMFLNFGYKATTFKLDISNWNTLGLSDMSSVFWYTGYNANKFEIDLSNWNTSSVKSFYSMFFNAGHDATEWSIGDLSNWNTSSVTNMQSMFASAGYSATEWSIGDLSDWNTSNVTNMKSMFFSAGYNSSTFELDLSNWNTSAVTNMDSMFNKAGSNATTWSIGDLSNWDTSIVTNMYQMFESAGKIATTWNSIGNFKVYADDIRGMFYNCSKAKASLMIYNKPSSFSSDGYNNKTFYNACTSDDSLITVFYAPEVDNIDDIIATKSHPEDHVVKGGLLGSDYTITLNPNGDTESVDPTSITVTPGNAYGELPIPETTVVHKNFLGWFTGLTDGIEVTSDMLATASITLYAHWEYIPEATFISGDSFNVKIKNIAGNNDSTVDTKDYNIEQIKVGSALPDGFVADESNTVSTEDSDMPIYIWYDENEKALYYYTEAELIKLNRYSYDMFFSLYKLSSIEGIENWDTSDAYTMASMFVYAGYDTTSFEIDLSNWDLANVVNIKNMFNRCGYNSTTWSIGDISEWDVSNVYTMEYAFVGAAHYASKIDLDLSNWDVSKVQSMDGMLNGLGFSATEWSIGDLSNWNTSTVTSMYWMFALAGSSTNTWSIGDISEWDVSQVTDMNSMFYYAGRLSNTWSIGDLSDWDTSNVSDMNMMFAYAGQNSTTWESIGNFKVYADNVKGMFSYCKNAKANLYVYNKPTYYTGYGGDEKMFYGASTEDDALITVYYDDSVDNIDNLILTKVYDNSKVVKYAMNSHDYTITLNPNGDTESVDPSSVIISSNNTFADLPNPSSTSGKTFYGWYTKAEGGYKITSDMKPTSDITLYARWEYHSEATFVDGKTFNVEVKKLAGNSSAIYSDTDETIEYIKRSNIVPDGINLSNTSVLSTTDSDTPIYVWYNSNEKTIYYYTTAEVIYLNTDSSYMFYRLYNLNSIEGVDSFNTSKLVNGDHLFGVAGYNSTSFAIDLSNWDTSNLVIMSAIFNQAGENSENWSVGDLSNWDTSKVIDMSWAFAFTGLKVLDWSIGDISNWNTSNVVDMNSMFKNIASIDDSFELDLSGWNTSKVDYMDSLFNHSGSGSTSKFHIYGLSNWDTSNVVSFVQMFRYAGSNATDWYVGDLSNWNVSNAISMYGMFEGTGQKAELFDLGDLSNWDTSKVTSMNSMFSSAGKNATLWHIGTLKIYADDIRSMFYNSSAAKANIIIYNKPTYYMNSSSYYYNVFYNTANKDSAQIIVFYDESVDNIDDIIATKKEGDHIIKGGVLGTEYTISFDANGETESVDVESITVSAGNSYGELPIPTTTINHKTFLGWYTGVTDGIEVTSDMYPTASITLYAHWEYNPEATFDTGENVNIKMKKVAGDTDPTKSTDNSNITQIKVGTSLPDGFVPSDINTVSTSDSDEPIYIWYDDSTQYLYYYTDANKIYLNSDAKYMFNRLKNLETIENIGNFDTSRTTSFYFMFYYTGYNSSSFTIDISNWNTSNVTSMSDMFHYLGKNATTWSIGDLSEWNVSNVKTMSSMFNTAGQNTRSWSIGDLSNWNVSNLESMNQMFFDAANKSSFNIGNIGGWDVSKVKSMYGLFYRTAYSSSNTSWYVGDLSNWNVSNVTNMECMFRETGKYSETWSVGDLSNWDTSKVTNMRQMFMSAGRYSTTWNSIGNFKIYADNVYGMFKSTVHAKANLFIYNKPSKFYDSYYFGMFEDAATADDSLINVFYAPEVDNIDDIIATKTNPEDHVYKAGMLGDDYVISLDPNGDTESVDPTSVTITPGNTYGVLPVPTSTKASKTFIGWFTGLTDGVEVTSDMLPTASITLYAHWDYHPEATFDTGSNVNIKMKNIAGNITDSNYDSIDENVEQIKVGSSLPDGFVPTSANTISSNNSDEPIYIWYDSTNKYLYYYTEAETIFVNSHASNMFYNFKKLSSIENINNWNSTNVTSMEYMFYCAGYSATTFELNLSNWNTSNAYNFRYMFYETGYNTSTFAINLSNWNTSNVLNMSNMFFYAGYNATTWSVDGLSNWDVSKVTDMNSLFSYAGYKATSFSLNLSNWQTSSLKYVEKMFYCAGYSATTWSIGNLSGWNMSKVYSTSRMFSNAGYNATTFDIGNLSSWNTSTVNNMYDMFSFAGYKATTFNIGDISNWNTSKVEDMRNMFRYAGYSTTSWNIGTLSNWDVSKVKYMSYMFENSGYNSQSFLLDLSNWEFADDAFINGLLRDAGYNATTWSVGDLSGWDVSNLSSLSQLFADAGHNATTWSVGDLSGWDTSKVEDMATMFAGAGKNSTTWNSIGNLNVYADDIRGMFNDCPKAKATLKIHNKPTNFTDNDVSYKAFYGAATADDSLINVFYDESVDNIDDIIATKKNPEDHVVKVGLIGSKYIVTLNPNGGNVTPESILINPSNQVGELPIPTRGDDEFLGWFTALSGGEEVTSSYVPTGDIKIYARWNVVINYICKPATTLKTEACNAASGKGCRAAGYGSGATITYGTLPVGDLDAGEAFDCKLTTDGDYTDRFYYLRTNGDNAVLISHSILSKTSPGTLVDNTEQITYSEALTSLPTTTQWNNLPVTFNGKAARLATVADISTACGVAAAVGETGDLNNCTYVLAKTGFAGNTGRSCYWADMVGTTYYRVRGDTRTIATADDASSQNSVKAVIEVPVDLVEIIVVNKLQITLNSNGGSSVTDFEIDEGSSLGNNLPTPTRSNYTFDGWHLGSVNGQLVDSSYVPTSDITLVAKWLLTNAQAEVNGERYATLAEAITAVPNTKVKTTVTLLKNIDLGSTIEIAKTKNIEFDMGSYTINYTPTSNNVFKIYGIVYIKNGTIKSKAGSGAINIEISTDGTKGELHMSGGTITATGSRQGLYNNGGILEISGTATVTASASARAAVHNLLDGITYIRGGTITSTGNQAVLNAAGTVIIGNNDGTIDTTTPVITGKTYGVENTAAIEFYDGIIKGISQAISDETKVTKVGEYVRGTEGSYNTLTLSNS